MTITVALARAAGRPAGLLLLAVAALGLAGCEGDSLAQGEPGDPGSPGQPGEPGGPAFRSAAEAEFINAEITAVTVPDDGQPVVNVRLTDEEGRLLARLPADSIRFVLARLEPGVTGNSTTWHAITRRTEEFPGTPPPSPPDFVTGTGPTNQGYTETGTEGTWVDNLNGTYEYKFAASLTDDPEIDYDPSLPHRVGLEIRTSPILSPENIPANNPTYTFRPSTGAVLQDSGREIVDNDTCNACHDRISAHGEARVDLEYCAMCHESFSFDAQTGNSLDLKVMIHKIHAGMQLPSVEAGGVYGIYGFRNNFQDFSEINFPQDLRNCQVCHEESDPETPQASNWRMVANSEVCGSCHDNVNFRTGLNHGGVAATNDQCLSCHGPDSSIQNGELRISVVHVDPVREASARFEYQVLDVMNTAPGEFPTVTIRVVDPTDGDAPYDILAPSGPFQQPASSLVVDIGWSTRPDFTNTGSGSATATTGTPAQPIRVDAKATAVPHPSIQGAFQVTAATPIPLDAIGSGSALLEGHPAVDINGDGVADTIPVVADGETFAITDASPVPYRDIVAIEKCNDCHGQLTAHGNNRTGNIELCAVCHNPNATDINRRVAGSECEAVTGTLDDQTVDLKVMIHAIHAGPMANYMVCGFRNSGHDYSDLVYPGSLNNCQGCHLEDTYYPPASNEALATTIDAGPDLSTPLGDTAVSPASAACASCHTSDSARVHMQLNGGTFDAIKTAESTIPAAPVETCSICHGPGGVADVEDVHGFQQFMDN